MPRPSLPPNVDFLESSWAEYQSLKTEPAAFEIVHDALVSLGKYGPPEGTRLVVAPPPFPSGLAYRIRPGRHTIVFESDQRLILQTVSGPRFVRALAPGGKGAKYLIWAIMAD